MILFEFVQSEFWLGRRFNYHPAIRIPMLLLDPYSRVQSDSIANIKPGAFRRNRQKIRKELSMSKFLVEVYSERVICICERFAQLPGLAEYRKDESTSFGRQIVGSWKSV